MAERDIIAKYKKKRDNSTHSTGTSTMQVRIVRLTNGRGLFSEESPRGHEDRIFIAPNRLECLVSREYDHKNSLAVSGVPSVDVSSREGII